MSKNAIEIAKEIFEKIERLEKRRPKYGEKTLRFEISNDRIDELEKSSLGRGIDYYRFDDGNFDIIGLGNPFLFGDTLELKLKDEYREPELRDIIETVRRLRRNGYPVIALIGEKITGYVPVPGVPGRRRVYPLFKRLSERVVF